MTAIATLTRIQAKVFLREPMSLFFGLVFPALLLLLIGLVFPGSTEPSPDFSNLRLVDVYAPVAIAFGLASVAISILPAVLGTDRERGILRRLSTTPVHPRVLVGAHLTVQLLVSACAALAAVLVGVLVFDIPLPQSPGWFIVSFLAAAASLLGLGLLIGAVVPTASAGQSIGMLLYFPLLFFAGVYVPMEIMPEGVRAVSEYTPAGAAVQALSGAWTGTGPESSSLLVMAIYAVVTGLAATWLFRWE